MVMNTPVNGKTTRDMARGFKFGSHVVQSTVESGNLGNVMGLGYGTYFYNNSAVYEGEWREDHRSGWGRMYYENGDFYEGEWMRDKNHGQGLLQFANGNWYEGSWQDGKRNGNGKLHYPDNGQLYEGLWVNGIAKCGTLSDYGRDEAPTPTKFPIPQLHLMDMQLVLKEAQSAYLDPS
ncbi:uncharacterized protein V6R79_020979 [Siganus canaliculatus]